MTKVFTCGECGLVLPVEFYIGDGADGPTCFGCNYARLGPVERRKLSAQALEMLDRQRRLEQEGIYEPRPSR